MDPRRRLTSGFLRPSGPRRATLLTPPVSHLIEAPPADQGHGLRLHRPGSFHAVANKEGPFAHVIDVQPDRHRPIASIFFLKGGGPQVSTLFPTAACF